MGSINSDNHEGEEEQLMIEKDLYTSMLPVNAKKRSTKSIWLLFLALTASMAVNVYLGLFTRVKEVEKHQMFCEY